MIDFVHIPGSSAIPIVGEVGGDGRITWYGECQICHCTELDCQRCIDVTGEPCSWANLEHTLCTRCVGAAFRSLAVPNEEDCTP